MDVLFSRQAGRSSDKTGSVIVIAIGRYADTVPPRNATPLPGTWLILLIDPAGKPNKSQYVSTQICKHAVKGKLTPECEYKCSWYFSNKYYVTMKASFSQTVYQSK